MRLLCYCRSRHSFARPSVGSLELSLQSRPDFDSIKGYASPSNFYNDGNSDTNYGGYGGYGDDYDDDDIYYEKAVEEDYEDDSDEVRGRP